MENKHIEIKPIYRYQVISEATGEVLVSTNNYDKSVKLLMFTAREYRRQNLKLYNSETNKTIMTVG